MNAKNINIVLIMLFLSVNLFGNGDLSSELTKSINKEFQLSADEKLILTNRYGYVKVKAWDEDKAKIDITIKVKAKNDAKAQELLDRISVKFSETSGVVSAETEIESNENWSIKINYNVKFEINYDVYMPRKAFLNLTNKYGNSEVASLERDINARIKYGDIKLADQSGNLELSLGYGDALIGNIGNISADVKYSNLVCGDAGNLMLDTKYSQFTFGTVGNMNVDSGYDQYNIAKAQNIKNNGKYDDWNIGELNQIDMETKYTDVEIDLIKDDARFEQKYGDILIRKVGQNAKSVDVAAGYTDVVIGAIDGYNLEFIGSYSDCRIHDTFDYSSKDKDGNSKDYSGSYGNGKTKIRIELKYGDLVIK